MFSYEYIYLCVKKLLNVLDPGFHKSFSICVS